MPIQSLPKSLKAIFLVAGLIAFPHVAYDHGLRPDVSTLRPDNTPATLSVKPISELQKIASHVRAWDAKYKVPLQRSRAVERDGEASASQAVTKLDSLLHEYVESKFLKVIRARR